MAFFVEMCPNLQDLLCNKIHVLHLCDNFRAFNINIEDFIGKNSPTIPLFPIKKVVLLTLTRV